MTKTAAATDYLDRVRAELADLPAGELEEVLDDVAGHLDEIGLELGADAGFDELVTRLGTPREYADELRAAAGYPPAARSRNGYAGSVALGLGILATLLLPWCMIAWIANGANADGLLLLAAIGLAPSVLGVVALRGRDPRIVTGHPLWRRGAALLTGWAGRLPDSIRHELVTVGRPSWWVIRGALAGLALYGALRGGGAAGNLLFGALGALASVWVARVAQRDRRWLWFVIPANVAAIVGLIALAGATGRPVQRDYGYTGTESQPGLWLDGNEVTNMFAFDQQGKTLDRFRLYNQFGQPLNLGSDHCPGPDGVEPYTEPDNLFPKITVQQSDDGLECKERTGPAFVVPPLAPRPTPTATPPATPSVPPSVSPSGTVATTPPRTTPSR